MKSFVNFESVLADAIEKYVIAVMAEASSAMSDHGAGAEGLGVKLQPAVIESMKMKLGQLRKLIYEAALPTQGNINHIPVWIVRDPGPKSEMVDILFKTKLGELYAYAIGTGARRWEAEHTTIYADEGSAQADADQRMSGRGANAFSRFL